MVKLKVDNRNIEAEAGTTLLQACLDNDIYIPNLCYLKEMHDPPASCRMCLVEIEGKKGPVASCTIKVKDAMIVKTDTPLIRRLQRTSFQLLMSVHHIDCKECPANKKCELQRLARFLKTGLKPKHLEQCLKETMIDEEHPFLTYYPNRCILCGKCIFVCRKEHGRSSLTFAKRGLDTTISSFGETGETKISCTTCSACVEICPVSAITLKNQS